MAASANWKGRPARSIIALLLGYLAVLGAVSSARSLAGGRSMVDFFPERFVTFLTGPPFWVLAAVPSAAALLIWRMSARRSRLELPWFLYPMVGAGLFLFTYLVYWSVILNPIFPSRPTS